MAACRCEKCGMIVDCGDTVCGICDCADEKQIDDEDRQPCEVWTRVMGYFRPVAFFNNGKRAEHEQRRFFKTERGGE